MPEITDDPCSQPLDVRPADCPVSFADVLRKEIDQINLARRARGVPEEKTKDSLIGLAFSGGGIRSATFNLGILQALAQNGLLHQFDYLSTVSGGGYIGSWLAAVTRRFLKAQPDKTFADVEAALKPEEYKPYLRRERSFLHWLRMYSNYLTPNSGMTSGDTWAMIGTWTRNAFLNQTILGLFFLGFFAFLQSLLLLLAKSRDYGLGLLFGGAVLMFGATVFMAHNIANRVAFRDIKKPTLRQRTRVTSTVMFPFLLACIVLNTGLWRCPELQEFPLWEWMVVGALFYCVAWGTVAAFALRHQREPQESLAPGPDVSISALLIFSPIAGLVGGALLWVYEGLLSKPRLCTAVQGCGAVNWVVVVLGPGAVMLCLLAVGALHLGLTGRGCRDLVREWWARLGGYMMLVTLTWLAIAGICAFGPLLLRWGIFKMGNWSISAALLWLVHNYLGVQAAKSAKVTGQTAKEKRKKTDPKTDSGKTKSLVSRVLQSPQLLNAIAKAAPYVFAAGLLLLLSTAVHIGVGAYFDGDDTAKLWHSSKTISACCGVATAPPVSSPEWSELCELYWRVQYHEHGWSLLLGVLILLGSSIGLSLRVDVNDFSLHHFYRNRLVRCYLGASNSDRRPQAFTGFDPADDVDLKEFGQGYPGPYPILNAALNITAGQELGYATRRAKSFIFTPLYCGYEVNAPRGGASWFERANQDGNTFVPTYSPTATGRTEKAIAKVETEGGISLGTAMAISGAAASPNMGYYTSAATGLFMTLFDVRLGWWMGNPRYRSKWRSPGPKLGLGYLFSELVAQSDQKKSFVYLSDGGHFENLAVYELLRRHCKLIVACDADCDDQYKFQNLVDLIEKARTDLGARIVVDFRRIRPVGGGRESEHNFVVGDIFYDPQTCGDRGKFIYIKASVPPRPKSPSDDTVEPMPNQLPDDVWQYYDGHKTFPHQSTADQWFDELQFESYRALGEFIGIAASDKIKEEISDVRG
jgi:hypothetical protein